MWCFDCFSLCSFRFHFVKNIVYSNCVFYLFYQCLLYSWYFVKRIELFSASFPLTHSFFSLSPSLYLFVDAISLFAYRILIKSYDCSELVENMLFSFDWKQKKIFSFFIWFVLVGVPLFTCSFHIRSVYCVSVNTDGQWKQHVHFRVKPLINWII